MSVWWKCCEDDRAVGLLQHRGRAVRLRTQNVLLVVLSNGLNLRNSSELSSSTGVCVAYRGVEVDVRLGSLHEVVKDLPVATFDLRCSCCRERAHAFERMYLVHVLVTVNLTFYSS